MITDDKIRDRWENYFYKLFNDSGETLNYNIDDLGFNVRNIKYNGNNNNDNNNNNNNNIIINININTNININNYLLPHLPKLIPFSFVFFFNLFISIYFKTIIIIIKSPIIMHQNDILSKAQLFPFNFVIMTPQSYQKYI